MNVGLSKRIHITAYVTKYITHNEFNLPDMCLFNYGLYLNV